MARTGPNTPHFQIFDYWKDKCIDSRGNVHINDDTVDIQSTEAVVYDWGEPACWGCGSACNVWDDERYDEWLADENLKPIWNHAAVRRRLQKAHILAASLGGEDKPENLFLLCDQCHRESPDTSSPRMFFMWVYQRKKRKHPVAEIAERVAAILDEEFGITQPVVSKDALRFGNVTFHPRGDKITTAVYAYVADALRNQTALSEEAEMLFLEIINARIDELSKVDGNEGAVGAYKEIKVLYERLKMAERKKDNPRV